MHLAETGLTQRQLVDQACAVRSNGVPPAVQEVAKQCLLDWLGVAIAGAREPSVRMLAAHIQALSNGGPARLIGHTAQVPILDAALVNGAAGHALDFDAAHDAFRGHPFAPIFPAIFAISDLLPISGTALLDALVAGTEVECNVSATIGDAIRARGFHPTAVAGVIGAATAVAQLIGLNHAQMTNAFGIAVCHASGLAIASGTMMKSLQVGNAAMNGARAALLAHRGFSAPHEVLERPRGFADLFGTGKLDKEPEALGGYFTMETLFKDYPCCFALHGVIDAAMQVRASPEYDPALVSNIVANVHPGLFMSCGIKAPTSAEETKFSLPYALGLVLAGGDPTSPEAWVPSANVTPQMINLMAKVEPTPVNPRSRKSCTLIVNQLNRVTIVISTPLRQPATDVSKQWPGLMQKFARLTEPVLGERRPSRIISAVNDLTAVEDVSRIIEDASTDTQPTLATRVNANYDTDSHQGVLIQ